MCHTTHAQARPVRCFVQAFYTVLAEGTRVGQAMLAGQQALYGDPYLRERCDHQADCFTKPDAPAEHRGHIAKCYEKAYDRHHRMVGEGAILYA